ncbi:thioredoxin domain-containing protein 17-like [Culex quinquefasciatus]|uniref:thioredoxin domain-containing protein 17-like n=1 Tax=Culex quinquefasciatus TaxID=7176 RepID=UPI0018E3848D|nr:thioredoxin domain-containing protein 17-like [Culex quinquefasciatus]
MVQKHYVAGFQNFVDFMKNFKADGQDINILFTGAKMDSGISWCSDCVDAAPFIAAALEKAPAESHFIYVDVGDRPTWKDMTNPFRKDTDTHLSVIPTLIRWKNPQRLEGEQCQNADLLDMFFNDETD